MQTSELQQLIEVIGDTLANLDVSISGSEVERLAITIHEAMTVQARSYHHLSHALSLLEEDNPIHNLVALYHDIVYYQVDMGFSPEIRSCITPYIVEIGNNIHVVASPPQDERHFSLVLEVFDLQPGDKLPPSNGLNEFLSALVLVRKLSGIVTDEDLLRVIVCIEASIPFRGHDARGKRYFDVLEERLQRISENEEYGLSGIDIEGTVRCALDFANKDVASFSEPDVGDFLDATWKLLPELNETLRMHEIYSIRSYREALMKMVQFQNELDPEHIFHIYRDEPSEDHFRKLVETARHNIHDASEYICLKLLAVGILEALAEATGGDAPLALFMGDLAEKRETTQRLEDYLPPEQENPDIDRSSTVYQLLISGRTGGSNFDVLDSPLALFVYGSLSPKQIETSIGQAIEYFDGCSTAREFLSKIEPQLLSAIASACAKMVPTRRVKLLEFTQ
jgi:hypothetical protein